MSEHTIRVVLADDDPLVRMAIGMLLGGEPGIELVAEAADGNQALRAVAEHRPDLVLMDVRMPELDGLAATERLRALDDPPEVVILTTFHADEQVMRALRAGASGFLLKHTPPAEIVAAIRRVASGDAQLSPEVTRRLLTHIAEVGGGDRRRGALRALATLSEREHEVALALGQGMTNAEITRSLHMSLPTVKTHVSRILTKLELNNRVQVALLVHDAELT